MRPAARLKVKTGLALRNSKFRIMGKRETRNLLATPADGAQNGAPHVGLRGATLSGQEAQGRVLAILTESSFEKSKVSA
jgi:hypothetical protein